MSETMMIHLANHGNVDRVVTVEDLCALHLPRYPLVKDVLRPSEQRPIQVTRDAPFRGPGSIGAGCIRVFYADGNSRTLTVCEGDAVEL
ncbi:MAG TPA: hypothetical protein VGD78_19950 [Chthoniobacterales bacterium]